MIILLKKITTILTTVSIITNLLKDEKPTRLELLLWQTAFLFSI